MVNAYPTYNAYPQQYYNYPTLPSVYSLPPAQNNSYTLPTVQTPVQYVDAATADKIRPRRQPRVYREVIVLPTPEPVYRQVRHRLPTPERQVIQRTIIQKANGDVIVEQQKATPSKRSQSRVEAKPSTRTSRPRQVHTD